MNIKRVALLIATNLGVMLVLSLTASLLGVNRFFNQQWAEPQLLAGVCHDYGVWWVVYFADDV